MKNSQGWTLIELLLVVTIIAILAGAAVPAFSGLIKRQEDSLTLRTFHELAVFARNSAINRSHFVTLCPSADGKICGEDWLQEIIVFTDPNRNEVLDPGEILLRSAFLPTRECVIWRGSSHQNHLQFKPSGGSNGIAGHFRFCEDVDNGIDQKIVVALTGRTSQKDL